MCRSDDRIQNSVRFMIIYFGGQKLMKAVGIVEIRILVLSINQLCFAWYIKLHNKSIERACVKGQSSV